MSALRSLAPGLVASLLGLTVSLPARADICFTSTVMNATPFMGNNEIFQLSDGSMGRVDYEYLYLYEYYPTVIVCPSLGKMILNGRAIHISMLAIAPKLGKATTNKNDRTGTTIESNIAGMFHGWDGDTIYQLTNGQIWQQVSAHVHVRVAASPRVLIYSSAGLYKLKVEDDDDEAITVTRLK